jgi:eukaryotic-like serine/threonine-protein kinase
MNKAPPPGSWSDTESASLSHAPTNKPAPVSSPQDRYELLEQIGQGSFGRLMRARDRLLNRIVAIKLLRQLSTEREARFRREAELTARLQHPSIVPIHDVGQWPTGEPFIAMKLVSGATLKEKLQAKATLIDRLPILPTILAVCEAVGYAHQQGVIHRDLKPANIMLGPHGEALVIDWGLAKAIDEPEEPDAKYGISPSSSASQTSADAIIGTPSYMSPEQARREPATRASDVYSLGALIYCVIAGRAPHEGDNAEGVLRERRARAPAPLATLVPDAPHELVAIAEKAMALAPADRYADGQALAADLKRFLDGQLVAAHRYSSWQLLRRFVKRHRRVMLTLALSAVAAALFAVYSFRRVMLERHNAQVFGARAESEGSRLRLAMAWQYLDRDPTLSVAWAKSYAATSAPDWRAVNAVVSEARSRGVASWVSDKCALASLSFDGTLISCAEGGKHALTRDGKPIRTLDAGDGDDSLARFSPDGSFITGRHDGLIRRWDVDTGAMRELAQLHDSPRAAAFSRDGKLIVIGGAHGHILVIDSADGSSHLLLGHTQQIDHLALGGDSTLASTSEDGTARLWSLSSGGSRLLPDPPHSGCIAVSPSGDRVAWGQSDGRLRLLDVGSGKMTWLRGHRSQANYVDFSPDGKQLASTSLDKTVRLWDLASAQSHVVATMKAMSWSLRFSPSGDTLGVTAVDGTLAVIDLHSGDHQDLDGGEWSYFSFDRGAGRILGSTPAGMARLWPVVPSRERILRAPEARMLAVRPDGTVVSVGAGSGREWNPNHGSSKTFALPGLDPDNNHCAITPDAARIACTTPQLFIVELATGKRQTFAESGANAVDISADGKQLIAGTFDTVSEYDIASGTRRKLGPTGGLVWEAHYSPDKRWVATSGDESSIRLYDRANGSWRALDTGLFKVYSIAFSPDSKTLASGGVDSTLRLWDTESGALRGSQQLKATTLAAVFSPDGRVLASSSADKLVQLWNLETGVKHVDRVSAPVSQLFFDARGQRLYGIGDDGAVRVWDVASAAELDVLVGHNGAITGAALTADGLVTSSEDGVIRAWTAVDRAPIRSRAQLDELTNASISDDDAEPRQSPVPQKP